MSVVSTQQLLTFGLAAFVIIAIPGPSVLFVIGRALTYGRGVALMSVLGNSLGLLVVMVLVAFGLGAVVAESVLVFTVIKLAGAAYMMLAGLPGAASPPGDARRRPAAALPAMPWRRSVRQGFVVGVTNPKAFMMYAAVLPSSSSAGRGT